MKEGYRLKERIEKALKGIEYEIREDAKIVATIQIHNQSFQFSRIETFKKHGLSLDNVFVQPDGKLYIIVSNVIGFPEIHDWLILSAEIDFEKSEECGYQTILVISRYEDRGSHFEIPNYNATDYNANDLLQAMLQQIVISKHEEMMEKIIREFNPFTAKKQGLNPKSAQTYIEDIKRTSPLNYHQLSHLFGQETVDKWLDEQQIQMEIIEKIEDLRQ